MCKYPAASLLPWATAAILLLLGDSQDPGEMKQVNTELSLADSDNTELSLADSDNTELSLADSDNTAIREIMMGVGNRVASVIMLTFPSEPCPHADFSK